MSSLGPPASGVPRPAWHVGSSIAVPRHGVPSTVAIRAVSGQKPDARLQHVVGAVAVGAVVGALAAAQVEGAGSLSDEAVRGEAGALMGAVAERLLGRAAARTPEIRLAGLEGDLIGPLLGADGLVGHLLV